jgi:hypothetical protein
MIVRPRPRWPGIGGRRAPGAEVADRDLDGAVGSAGQGVLELVGHAAHLARHIRVRYPGLGGIGVLGGVRGGLAERELDVVGVLPAYSGVG